MIEAKVIADSKNEFGQRITTFILTFPRYLLAEVNTHRMLSRNSASSRAIRFQQMVKRYQDNPFIPLRFQKDHSGMQGTEYFEGAEHEQCIALWLDAKDAAIKEATRMHTFGITKQLANRCLEPYMMHTCLLTGTEFENFFALRAHEAAEIHFQDLAKKMLVAINESEPVQLKAGEWHIPFGDKMDFKPIDIIPFVPSKSIEGLPLGETKYLIDLKDIRALKVKLATVRCARVSYNTQDNDNTIEKDLELHDRLEKAGHYSAFEHCACAMSKDQYDYSCNAVEVSHKVPGANPQSQDVFQGWIPDKNKGWCGNFRGFIQYRKMFLTENRNDSRLIKK